jgi:hypothetical protein
MTKRISLTILLLGLAAGLIAAGAVANNGKPSPSPRAQSAPGANWAACAQHPRGSVAFRVCVRNAAKARRAERINMRAFGLLHGVGRICAPHKGNRVAFRNCVHTEIQRRKAAYRQCRAQHPRGSQALRNCMRAAKTP